MSSPLLACSLVVCVVNESGLILRRRVLELLYYFEICLGKARAARDGGNGEAQKDKGGER